MMKHWPKGRLAVHSNCTADIIPNIRYFQPTAHNIAEAGDALLVDHDVVGVAALGLDVSADLLLGGIVRELAPCLAVLLVTLLALRAPAGSQIRSDPRF